MQPFISPAYKNAEQPNSLRFSLPIFTLQLDFPHGSKQCSQESWQILPYMEPHGFLLYLLFSLYNPDIGELLFFLKIRDPYRHLTWNFTFYRSNYNILIAYIPVNLVRSRTRKCSLCNDAFLVLDEMTSGAGH